jgi:hypothetical protein
VKFEEKENSVLEHETKNKSYDSGVLRKEENLAVARHLTDIKN